MVASESDRLDRRRARLFLCACVRRLDAARHGTYREAVELAERYADGRASVDELRSMRYTFRYRFTHPAGMLLAPDDGGPLELVQRGLVWLEAFGPSDAEHAARLALWRDVFGGQGVRFDPAWAAWEGGTVRRLAEAIDRERTVLHNEGADLMAQRLAGKVDIDHGTARRLFALVSALRWRV